MVEALFFGTYQMAAWVCHSSIVPMDPTRGWHGRDRGGALELPRPANDPRPKEREDGMMVMNMSGWFTSPCGDLVIEFTIGECVKGDCPQCHLSHRRTRGW